MFEFRLRFTATDSAAVVVRASRPQDGPLSIKIGLRARRAHHNIAPEDSELLWCGRRTRPCHPERGSAADRVEGSPEARNNGESCDAMPTLGRFFGSLRSLRMIGGVNAAALRFFRRRPSGPPLADQRRTIGVVVRW